MTIKKISFAVSNPLKCIANLRLQPMHFKMNLEIYQIQKVMNAVLNNPVNSRWLNSLETIHAKNKGRSF